MQTKDTLLYFAIGGIIFLSMALGIYRYAIAKDFLIEQDVWCDAEAGEQCFYEVCLNDWWWPCTGDPEADIWVHKRVTKPYRAIEEDVFSGPCIPGETIGEDEFCPEIACEEGEEDCTVLYCDPAVDEDCYVGENIAASEEEWLARLAEVGLEPVVAEEEVTDEAETEEGAPLDGGDGPEETGDLLEGTNEAEE